MIDAQFLNFVKFSSLWFGLLAGIALVVLLYDLYFMHQLRLYKNFVYKNKLCQKFSDFESVASKQNGWGLHLK